MSHRAATQRSQPARSTQQSAESAPSPRREGRGEGDRDVHGSTAHETTEALDAQVIIIGGGPAGSTLGAYLARARIDHIILDQAVHPAAARRRIARLLHHTHLSGH